MIQGLHEAYKTLRKHAMVDAAKAYIRSTPHHQIAINIVDNLKYDDTLYLEEEEFAEWELHANCPDYLESLDLRLTLYHDNPRDESLIQLWLASEYPPLFLSFKRSSTHYIRQVSTFLEELRLSNPPHFSGDMSELQFIKQAFDAYIKEHLA